MIITTVRGYKYLGFLVSPSGEVTTGIQDVRSRRSFALVQLRKKLGYIFRKEIGISIYLFDILAKPILLYFFDFWSILTISKKDPCELKPKQNLADLVHMRFLKKSLRVQTQNFSMETLLETGRVPLMTYAIHNCIKNWNRIANENNCNPLMHCSFENIPGHELEWYKISNYWLIVWDWGIFLTEMPQLQKW